MIAQKVKTEISSVVAKFGNGDIAVGVKSAENLPNVLITFSNIPKEEVGKEVEVSKCENTPIILDFDSLESINVLKEMIEKAVKELEKKRDAAKKDPLFTVDISKIFVTSCFKTSNPSAEKVVKCQKYFMEHGKLDKPVVVSESITLTDGYVRYLVGMYNGIQKIDVIAPKGINIKLGDQVVNFVSDEIEVSYGLAGKEEKFYLCIKNGDKTYRISAVDNVEATNTIKKIISVFDAKITIRAISTLNDGLSVKLKEAGIPFEYNS